MNSLQRVAAFGLRESGEITVDDVDEFLAGVARERLGGHAIAALESGSLRLDDAEVDELFAMHHDQLALDLQLELLLAETAQLLDHKGIEYRALKGPALAHTVYAEPARRSFGDVDLLVRSADFDAAVDALKPRGFQRRFIEPRPRFDARFSKGACLERRDGMEVDLHRSLAPGVFGMRIGETDLFARAPVVIDLAGHCVDAFDRELALVHASFHAALGNSPPKLVPLRDVVELVRAGVDTATMIELFTAARCEAVAARAFELVERDLGVGLDGPLATWAQRHRVRRFDRWALRSYEGPERSYAAQAAVSLWALPSLRHRVNYLFALAMPSRAYVRSRGGYARRVREGVRLTRVWWPR